MQPEVDSEALFAERVLSLICGSPEKRRDTYLTLDDAFQKFSNRERCLEIGSDQQFVRLLLTAYGRRVNYLSQDDAPDGELVLNILEMKLKAASDALAKDSSDIDGLLRYFRFLNAYLCLMMPHRLHLFQEPLSFLDSVLSQARSGSSHPVLQQKVHSRPMEIMMKKRFKVSCVVAGDLYFEADKQAGLHRRFLTRPQADGMICKQSRVQKTAKKFGLRPTPTAMKGWRREIRAAHESSPFKLLEKIARENAQEMPDVNAAVDLILGIDMNEQRII